jgi:NitT/TauT family transport system substrate-binding protein
MRYFLVLLLSWLLVACSASPATALCVGYNNWPGYELIWLADRLGYFNDAGVSVEHVQFVSLADAKRAYQRGQIDAVGVTAIELLQIASNAQTLPAQVAMVLDISHGADQVLAGPSIRQLSDIKGKRFGVEADSVSVQLAALLVQKAGLTLQDIHWVVMPPAQMSDAMKSGAIDLAATYAPYSIDVQSQSSSRVLFSSADVPNMIVDMLAVHPEARARNPKAWQVFFEGVTKAADYYHAHPQEAVQIMAEHAGMSVDDMNRTLAGLHIPTRADQLSLLSSTGEVVHGIRAAQQLLPQLGFPMVALSADQLINPLRPAP